MNENMSCSKKGNTNIFTSNQPELQFSLQGRFLEGSAIWFTEQNGVTCLQE